MAEIERPFRRSLSHFSVTNDPKHTIMSSLATLVTLSYTKVSTLQKSLHFCYCHTCSEHTHSVGRIVNFVLATRYINILYQTLLIYCNLCDHTTALHCFVFATASSIM